MKSEMIMNALSQVHENYIMESAPGEKKKKKLKNWWVAAAIVVVMALGFLTTDWGVQALDSAKEMITDFIQKKYPPKKIPINKEGDEEIIDHISGGREPVIGENGEVLTPGFVIYYDPESLMMTEEKGVTYFQPKILMDNDFYPPTYMEITHIPELGPKEAAEKSRKELVQSWPHVSDVSMADDGRCFINFMSGQKWNSPCGEEVYVSDGRGGCFRIAYYYFFEAAEGWAINFAVMASTFEVIDSK